MRAHPSFFFPACATFLEQNYRTAGGARQWRGEGIEGLHEMGTHAASTKAGNAPALAIAAALGCAVLLPNPQHLLTECNPSPLCLPRGPALLMCVVCLEFDRVVRLPMLMTLRSGPGTPLLGWPHAERVLSS